MHRSVSDDGFPSPPKPLCILSLDGGGVRGLSSLLILQHFMQALSRRLKSHAILLPCEVFDLIIGTNTGGIIALMLGRLRMSVSDCIEAYANLARNVFGKPRSAYQLLALAGKSMYHKHPLEAALKELVKEMAGSESMTLGADEYGCKTAVVAALQEDSSRPVLLRSYSDHPDFPAFNSAIWEAGRATTATPLFFPPVVIGSPPCTYLDGTGSGHGNPARLAVREAEELWPGRALGCLLSIGTGSPSVIPVKPWAHDIVKHFASLAAQCSRVDDKLARQFKDNSNTPYFRFSVRCELISARLDEWEEISPSSRGGLNSLTDCYMGLDEQVDRMRRCLARFETALSPTPTSDELYEINTTQSEEHSTEIQLRPAGRDDDSTVRPSVPDRDRIYHVAPPTQTSYKFPRFPIPTVDGNHSTTTQTSITINSTDAEPDDYSQRHHKSGGHEQAKESLLPNPTPQRPALRRSVYKSASHLSVPSLMGQRHKGRVRSMENIGSERSIGSLPEPAVWIDILVEGKGSLRYQLGNCIGRGQFGSVYLGLNIKTGETVAVKRIRLEGLADVEVQQLKREVELMRGLNHPAIVKYVGACETKGHLNIVLEYAENGSLAQTLRIFGKLNEDLVARLVSKILRPLGYLHDRGIVHCDLKASNILTTKNGDVRLSDFGVSLNLRAKDGVKNDVAGTPNWMAPEIIELKGVSTGSDIWSLGCTIIELLTGRPPYAELNNSMSVMFKMVDDRSPPIPGGFSNELRDFLSHCFNANPSQRPTATALLDHPWLKGNKNVQVDVMPHDTLHQSVPIDPSYERASTGALLVNNLPDNPMVTRKSSDGVPRKSSERSRPLTRHKSFNASLLAVASSFTKPSGIKSSHLRLTSSSEALTTSTTGLEVERQLSSSRNRVVSQSVHKGESGGCVVQ